MSEKLYTLDEAILEIKRQTKEKMLEGTKCPCCGQLVRLWKQKIHSGMSAWLIMFIQEFDKQDEEYLIWKHVAHNRGLWCGDYAKLRYWGLIEQASNDDTAKKTSGQWRPTELGREFAMGNTTIPKYVYTYDTKALVFSNSQTTVKESLGSKFDYEELIKG